MNPKENSSPASPAAPQGLKPHRLIKLGVDGHLREYVVVRQIDSTALQLPVLPCSRLLTLQGNFPFHE